jgi:hypothetical protein
LRFYPRLEALEDRMLPSVSASPAGGEFIRYNDGEVFFHDGSFQKVDINSVAISGGVSFVNSNAVPAVYIVYNNSDVYEWSQGGGFHFIDINAVAVSATPVATDTVFILYNNGKLFEHQGQGSGGFTFVAGAVAQFSGGFVNGVPGVFYVQTNHMLSVWSPFDGMGSKVVDGNVASVAATKEGDEAFVTYTNHQLFQVANATSSPTFTYIDDNVSTAGYVESLVNGVGMVAAYYLTTNGVLIEWQPPTMSYPDGTYNYVDSNVAGFGAGYTTDLVFIIYGSDMLYQHTGVTRALSSFTFIDSNVGP